MAAGERIFLCTSVGGLTKATHVGIEPSIQFVVDPGCNGALGPADFLITSYDLQVTVYGEDETELLGKIAGAKADLVIGTIGLAGAAETHTIKDVVFTEMGGEMPIPAADEDGPAPIHGVKGRVVNWGAAKTFADKLEAA